LDGEEAALNTATRADHILKQLVLAAAVAGIEAHVGANKIIFGEKAKVTTDKKGLGIEVTYVDDFHEVKTIRVNVT
jgi:hypothetical protein